MVAYNFQARFVPHIESGRKTHTIRRNGKRRHARPGERLQLYVNQRSPACRKIIDDSVCALTVPVTIYTSEDQFRIWLGDEFIPLAEMDEFAKSDGFESMRHMQVFWLKFNGPGVFVGTMIEWSKDA